MESLFRREAVEQRHTNDLGVVVKRQSRLASAGALLLVVSLAALVLWLSIWQVAPGVSLLAWIAAR